MDGSFHTLGENEFGAIWFVEGEGKIVVNAYQAAMYFGVDDFLSFARMVGKAGESLSGGPKAPPPQKSSKIRQFRPSSD